MMSKATTSRTTERGGGRVAGLHRQADKWRFVVVERDGRRFRVVHSEAIRYGDVGAARAAIARHKVDRLVRVAPAARTVCRVVEIPAGSPSEMAGAAALLGEAQLPGSAPAHRRGAGVIGGSSGPGRRNGLIVAWLGDPQEPGIEPTKESWTSEIVALTGLLALGGAESGAQAMYADRESGSIAVYAVNGSSSVARTMREQGAAPEEWRSILSRTIDETRRTLGTEFELEDDEGSAVRLNEDARRALLTELGGAARGDRWLDDFGVALGAAAGLLGADEGGRGLYGLRAEAGRERRSVIAKTISWTSDPMHAGLLTAGALSLALLAPIGVNAARVMVLRSKLNGIEAQLEGRESARDLDRRASFLNELTLRRWPMTKLLSDLAGALPVGVEVESITMDRGTRVQVRGEAGSLELANKCVSTLNESGVFTNAQLMQTKSIEGGKLEYRIEAEVARPFATARGIEDFSSETLAVRLYGERARGYAPEGGVAVSDDINDGTPAASRSRARERSGPTFTGETPARTETVEVPPPLTDDEIKAMSRIDAMREVAKRDRAASAAATDEDRQRLRDEAERLRAHARGSGGGA